VALEGLAKGESKWNAGILENLLHGYTKVSQAKHEEDL
jgi:hypothetical protein